MDTTEIALQTLVEWFTDCWQQTSGPKHGLTARIGIRGDIEVFDLNRSEWIPTSGVDMEQ